MPNINEMMESRFLRKEVLEQFKNRQRTVTIERIEQGNTAKEDEEPRYQWLMKFAEFKEPMILKATNLKLLATIFNSDEANDWIGQRCVLYLDPTIQMRGQIVGGMRVRAVANPAEQVQQLARKVTQQPAQRPPQAPRRQVREPDFIEDYEAAERAQRGPRPHQYVPDGPPGEEEEEV